MDGDVVAVDLCMNLFVLFCVCKAMEWNRACCSIPRSIRVYCFLVRKKCSECEGCACCRDLPVL